jgi:hypothetical protein
MTDNFQVTPGTGITLRTKDLSGKHLQVLFAASMIPTVVAGNQTLSVGTGSDTTLTVPSGATHALITVDSGGGNIRFWEDGTSPSTTNGLLISAGSAAELTNLSNIKMRATTGTVAVNISYRRYDQ